MNWIRLALLTMGAGILTSLTDWFFAGDWIHRRYTYPEIWRQGAESKAIAMTSPLPFLTCGFFSYLAARLGLHTVPSAVKLAVAVWLIGPLPLILTNARLHETSSGVRDVLCSSLVNKARDRRACSRLVSALNNSK